MFKRCRTPVPVGTHPGVSVIDIVAEASAEDSDDATAWALVEGVTRSLYVREATLAATLEAVLRAAVDVVGPAHSAGVNLLERGRFEPQAVFGEPPHHLDRWQQEHGEGPCIEASRSQQVIRLDDTTRETRWSGFGERAAALGVCSMLCAPLWIDETRLGSVSVYAGTTAAFSSREQTVVGLVATQAAIALGDALRTQQLRTMAANRDLIGQAKGILMERHKLTADAAFDLLRVASQNSNRKLVEVADGLVATGSL